MLSAEETLELASYLAQLTRSELPVGTALKALSAEAKSPRLSRYLAALVARLEYGATLVKALDSLAAQLPAHLRGIILAATSSSNPAPLLDNVLAQARQSADMTRRFWQAVAYPAALLVFLVAWLLFMTLWLVPHMVEGGIEPIDWFTGERLETSSSPLWTLTQLLPKLLGVMIGGAIALFVAARIIGGRPLVSRLFGVVPLLGIAWRNRGLAEFCGMASAFLRQQLPLAEALRLTSLTLRDPAMARDCLQLSTAAAQGQSLASSMTVSSAFPPTLVRFVAWGQQHAALSEALSDARQMFAERFDLRLQVVRLVMPPMIFVLAAGSALTLAVQAFRFMLPMVRLLAVSGGPPSEGVTLMQLTGVASVLATGLSLVVAAYLLHMFTRRTEPMGLVLRNFGFVLLALGLLPACLLLAGGWGFFGWIVIIVVWIRVSLHFRAAQRRNLLVALTLAINKQMPLAPIVRAVADENDGGFALRCGALADRLEQGDSLAIATRLAPRTLPKEAELAAHIGRTSGDLPGALRATRGTTAFDRTLLRSLLVRLLYLSPLSLLLVVYVKVQIEPSMRKVFADFDVPLPVATQSFAGATGDGLIIAAAAFFGTIAILTLMLWGWLQWRGTLVARLPELKRICNWVDMAPVLRSLALSAGGGRPLNDTFMAVARWHPKRTIRHRVTRAAGQLDRGRAWQDCLRDQRLISATDLAVLSAAERSGNLPWALQEMADAFERKANYRLQAWAQILLPVAILPMALLVATVAVAYISPIAMLIRYLSL